MTQKIGIIAGNGQFPILFAQAANRKGWEVYAVGYRGETDPLLERDVNTLEWLYVGQIKRIIKFFRKHGITQAVMIGGVAKTRLLTHFRPDTKALALLARMRHTHDDAILRAFADLLENEGIRIESSTFLLPGLVAPAGPWTKRKPSRSELEDMRFGFRIAKEIGRLDIGQCVVVARGSIMAVEAIEGTDAAIMRGGGLGKGQAVAVKVCKPNQDTRFDMPAVGLETIHTMQRSAVKALAVEAGKAVVFDRDSMIRQADRLGISIVGLNEADMTEKE